MNIDKIVKVEYPEGKDLEESLNHLKGNRFIEELELIGLRLDRGALEKLAATLSSLVSLKRLACIYVLSKDKNYLFVILEAVRKHKICALEIYDTSLEDDKVKNFATEISTIDSLKTLILSLENKEITDIGITGLCSVGFRRLTSLTTLSLGFKYCNEISHEGIASLGSVIKHLTSLTTLNLDFRSCGEITDKGMASLASGIRSLTSLTTLGLNFDYCFHITDEGTSSLCSQIIKHQTSLKNFTIWTGRTKMLDNIQSEAKSSGVLFSINPENSEEESTIVFRFKREVKLESINDDTTNKVPQGSVNTTSALCIDSSKGLKEFCLESSEGGHKLLKELTVTFRNEAFKQELEIFCSKGLSSLTSLTTLSLHFEKCGGTSGKRMARLGSALRHLTSLTTLNVNFRVCYKLSDKGIANLGSEIRHLTSLRSLSFTFVRCYRITSQGFASLRGLLKYLGFKSL